VPVGQRNLARLAEQAFERHGDYESLFFEGTWLRSRDLFERSRRLAGGLVELGVEPGDRVVVMMANCPEVALTYTALWRAGAVVTPAIFLLPPDELRHVLSDAEARVVVTTPEFLLTVQLAADGLDSVRAIVCHGGGEGNVVEFTSLEQAPPGDIVARADDDLAALLYTGGTTGRAKGVMLSHGNLWSCARSANEASYIPGLVRYIVPLPLAHAYGLSVTVTGMHTPERGHSVLMRWFDAAGFCELVAEHGLQRATLVPSMLQILLGHNLEDYDLSSLRYVNSGGAPLAPEVLEQFERRVPNVEILEGYGLTESGGIMSVNPPGARRIGSVGTPLPGYEVRVESDAEGLGEILCRAEGVMQGYWRAPEATGATLRDGWLHTGDIGRLDDDDYIWIVDRKKDLIIRGGFNVFPRDVEDALLEHPAVAMAAVVGRPDERYGEEVVAFVSLHAGEQVAGEELVAFGKQRLGGYKYPREVRVLDAIPLTPVGKTDRKAVRALL
jgi:long-chain acyl-CoA synthetase